MKPQMMSDEAMDYLVRYQTEQLQEARRALAKHRFEAECETEKQRALKLAAKLKSLLPNIAVSGEEKLHAAKQMRVYLDPNASEGDRAQALRWLQSLARAKAKTTERKCAMQAWPYSRVITKNGSFAIVPEE